MLPITFCRSPIDAYFLCTYDKNQTARSSNYDLHVRLASRRCCALLSWIAAIVRFESALNVREELFDGDGIQVMYHSKRRTVFVARAAQCAESKFAATYSGVHSGM